MDTQSVCLSFVKSQRFVLNLFCSLLSAQSVLLIVNTVLKRFKAKMNANADDYLGLLEDLSEDALEVRLVLAFVLCEQGRNVATRSSVDCRL